MCSSVNVSNEIKFLGNIMKVIYFIDGFRLYGGFFVFYIFSEDVGNIGCYKYIYFSYMYCKCFIVIVNSSRVIYFFFSGYSYIWGFYIR